MKCRQRSFFKLSIALPSCNPKPKSKGNEGGHGGLAAVDSFHSLSRLPQLTTTVYRLQSLLDWTAEHGGHIHEQVELAHDESLGMHLRVRKNNGIKRETIVIKTPLAVTMSYWNAVDHSAHSTSIHDSTTFSSRGLDLPSEFIASVGPDETTIFFLMGQYLKGAQGFWYPYLRTLPQPGAGSSLSTPLYYDGEDLEWLAGTSLAAARDHRMHAWKEKFGRSWWVLRDVGFGDVERYTWYVFQPHLVL